jgi:hypothetical protein
MYSHIYYLSDTTTPLCTPPLLMPRTRQRGDARSRKARKSRRTRQSCKSPESYKRRSARRVHPRRVQRGGGGQYGRTVMPIKYYGGDDSSAYIAPAGRSGFATSYGESVPTNFGTSDPALGSEFAGPNLAPGRMGDFGAVTGIQTGGGWRKCTGCGELFDTGLFGSAYTQCQSCGKQK